MNRKTDNFEATQLKGLKNLINKLRLKIFRKPMYPEIERAGSLARAVDKELEKINSAFRVKVDDNIVKLPFAYIRVENGTKFSQILIVANEKLYSSDFWRDGVCLTHGRTNNIQNLVKAIDFWLSESVSIKELSAKYNFIEYDDRAKAYDENGEVEYSWNQLLKDDGLGLTAFVALAIKDEIIKGLFPFTSLYTLRFCSRSGFPSDSGDFPDITRKQNAQLALQKYTATGNEETVEPLFVVTKSGKEYLGVGNAEDALKILKANLPNNIKSAIKGTVG